MPRPPPKKHQVKRPQAIWKPGDSRQVIAEANDRANSPAQTLAVTVGPNTAQSFPHTLGRVPLSALITHGSPKVTVARADEKTVTLLNSDAAPQPVTVALS